MWSTARLAHEMETNDERLNNGVQELLSAEREQGRSSPPPPTMLGSSLSVSDVTADPSPDKINFGSD